MHTTAAIGIGSVQPGQGTVSGAAACKPISSNKSPAPPVVGAAAAGLGAAGLVAACAAGFAAGLAAAAGEPGIFSGFWQAGHLTVLPASSSLAANDLPHA